MKARLKLSLLALSLCLLLLSNGCTHVYYKDPKTCAEISYYSTKDIKGLKVEMDGLKVELDGSENQASEMVESAVKALMLKKKKEKAVMEALTK